MIIRTATDDLAEGLGTIRWGDDETRIRALHPEAYVRSMPGVGSPLVVPDLVEELSPLRVKGHFFFGPEGVKYVVLSESSWSDGVDVRPCVHALARRFRFGPVTDSKRQCWSVRGTQVLLHFPDWFEDASVPSDFLLRVNRPGDFQPDFRIFEGRPLPPRREPQSPPALDHHEMTAVVRPDRFVVCPFCGKAFSLDDSARWSGERHLTCGQRIRLEPRDA